MQKLTKNFRQPCGFADDNRLYNFKTQEGHAKGLAEGLAEGEMRTLVMQTCKKLAKNQSVAVIADALETDPETVRRISDAAASYAPEYNTDAILAALMKDPE